ncbi:hypothetical protein F5Y16DRAFT_394069 [Xylariaceae sp. FL0255]|nr:hypothetical protein F5Y16DRAFT_394069 [Xylariaceae sp. FL0255]
MLYSTLKNKALGQLSTQTMIEKILPKKKVSKDPWLRPALISVNYSEYGDAYDDQSYKALAAKWADGVNINEYPYMKWVKEDLAENGGIHLRLLADFMSIGTVPRRWNELDPANAVTPEQREKRLIRLQDRCKRTKVAVLDYYTDKVEQHEIIETVERLDEKLTGLPDKNVQFRLFVVEDLSRDVIETLGIKIEPDFFRAHIADYIWYNVRDRWRDPPSLRVASNKYNWRQLRYMTLRYFDSRADYDLAFQKSQGFNIQRRVDEDLSNMSHWDKEDAIVGLIRTRATYWLQPESESTSTGARIGVLLLDPAVTEGEPLWRGGRTCWPTPQFSEKYKEKPPIDGNIFNDFIFWARQNDIFRNSTTAADEPLSKGQAPMRVLLYLTCTEWLTLADYIKTRLNQFELELLKPKVFRPKGQSEDTALTKLNGWRRLFHQYLEMVSGTMEHLHFPPSYNKTVMAAEFPETFAAGGSWVSSRTYPRGVVNEMPPEDERTPPESNTLSPPLPPSSLIDYQSDFLSIRSQLEVYQKHADRLLSFVLSIASMEDTRRSRQDNQNIGRLTWLATITIPFSLVSAVLSMQPLASDISPMTYSVYFGTAIPLAFLVTLVALAFRSKYARLLMPALFNPKSSKTID